MDVDQIHEDAWPALMADLTAEEPSIIASAFGMIQFLLPNVLMQTKPRAFICLHFCWDCLVSPSRMILFHGICTVPLKSGFDVIALMMLNRFHKKVPT